MQIHESLQWLNAITATLWPHAARAANDAINHALSMHDAKRRSPMEMFAKTNDVTNLLQSKPLRCPVHDL
jgi:hypothetical protein